jgi:hypothetical protein
VTKGYELTGLVDTSSTPRLMNLVSARKLEPLVCVIHLFPLEETEAAYNAFAAARETGAFKFDWRKGPAAVTPRYQCRPGCPHRRSANRLPARRRSASLAGSP